MNSLYLGGIWVLGHHSPFIYNLWMVQLNGKYKMTEFFLFSKLLMLILNIPLVS